MKTLILMLLTILATTACNPEIHRRYEVVEKNTITVATFDESLLEPCAMSEPPQVEPYKQANRDVKEAKLVTYSADLITEIKRCNVDKATLKAMLQRQKESIQKFNADEEARVKALVIEKKKDTP